VAAPDRGATDPAGKQTADPGVLLPRAVVVPRDAPTAFLLGGPGQWVRRPAQEVFRRHTYAKCQPLPEVGAMPVTSLAAS